MLGPTLFLVFVNDLPSVASSNIQMFADDTKIYRPVPTSDQQDMLQQDLDSLSEWSRKWQLPFNEGKCTTLHLGPRNSLRRYKLNGKETKDVPEERDLGIVVDSGLKFRTQAAAAAAKASRMLRVVRKVYSSLDKDTLPLLYKSLVRPHLEYGNPIWGPFNKADQQALEKVQRRATKLVPSVAHLSYTDRLKALEIPSLLYRRRRGDMIWVYNIMTGKSGLRGELFFSQPTSSATRGHTMKIRKPEALTRERRNHLAIRAVNDWNSLPNWVVTSQTTNTFKNNLDRHWAASRYITPFTE